MYAVDGNLVPGTCKAIYKTGSFIILYHSSPPGLGEMVVVTVLKPAMCKIYPTASRSAHTLEFVDCKATLAGQGDRLFTIVSYPGHGATITRYGHLLRRED